MTELIVSGERRMTHGELAERAARAAAGLESLGVEAGNAVAVLMRNDLPMLEVSVAAGLLGAYSVPINWHLAADEVAYVLRDCGAQVLLVHADLLAAMRHVIPDGMTVLGVTTPPELCAAFDVDAAAAALPPDVTEWNGWLPGFEPRPPSPADPPSAMLYTGGTTGKPKGVRRKLPTPEEAEGFRQTLTITFGLEPGMRTVVAGPLYHSAPNAYAVVALKMAAHLVLQPRFDAEGLLALIQEHRVTHLYAVPTMFVRLLNLPEAVRRRYDVSSLKFVIHAAAPCPPEVKRAMIEWWGPIINEFYGSTEGTVITLCSSDEALERPGTVGKCLPWVTARIYDENGTEAPQGVPGELYARNTLVADFTYHGLDEKRREMERDGLITVGDIGYFDPEGYLFLCDRRIDMIISGGVNIYPAEIEAVLITLPGVADCAVFGIPDPEFGESVAAAVQPQPGHALTEDGVRDWLRERIAHYKVPKQVEFRDALPRIESGKLLKRRLREPYWAGSGRSI